MISIQALKPMIRHAIAVFVLLYSMVWAKADYHPKPDETWPLVAKAEAIVTGTLEVPVDEIRKCLSNGQHRDVNISVKCDRVIKGSVPEDLEISWFTKPSASSPDLELLIKLNRQKGLLFISKGEKQWYFCGYGPQGVLEASDSLEKRIQGELQTQKEVLRSYAKAIPQVNTSLLQAVRKLFDNTTRKETQMDAFRQLIALGWDGVPAMIILMDDRRDLAIPHIELENPEGHFEGIRHYGPRRVVDAVAAILNQITKENFGFIYNGDESDKSRKDSVDGWRMYLYYWKKAEAAQISVRPGGRQPEPVESSDDFRTSVATAGKLMVYEGLPHPLMERERFKKEMKREDVVKIGGCSFYTPAVQSKDQEKLRKLLTDPETSSLYGGPKLCGGFHPDFAVVWESGGNTYQVLICCGCHEVLYLEAKRKLMYDLSDDACAKLRASLTGHVLKRPVE